MSLHCCWGDLEKASLRPISCGVSCILVWNSWHRVLLESGSLAIWMEVCLDRAGLKSRRRKNHTSLTCRICCVALVVLDAQWAQLSVQNKGQLLKDINWLCSLNIFFKFWCLWMSWTLWREKGCSVERGASSREGCCAGARNPVCCCRHLAGGCACALCVQGRRMAALGEERQLLLTLPQRPLLARLMWNLVLTLTPSTQ